MIRLQDILFEDTKWTGESWTACRQWKSHRNQFKSGTAQAKITITHLVSSFVLRYVGPKSGISISHASGGSGDTLHQLFNVMVCELNPWLALNNAKPLIDHIVTECKYDSGTKKYEFIIIVPYKYFDPTNIFTNMYNKTMGQKTVEHWQINHRGGWGHDPGVGAVKAASPKSPQLETATTVTTIPNSKNVITTHYAIYPL